MKKYKVVFIRSDFDTYIVSAKNKKEAIEKAMLGDAESIHSEPSDSEFQSAKVIKNEDKN